ncbi:MAG: hypothetical protein ACM33V_07755 [Chloroflexota bacterium]|nr:hypothetical protein [Anaerolineales bacterium]
MISRTEGWVGNRQRSLEMYKLNAGVLLMVDGCDEYLISDSQAAANLHGLLPDWSESDRQVILGPALVLALALCGTWCLHASAVTYRDKTVAFVGESGQGKSTLAAYLSSSPNWRLVADDILPVEIGARGMGALSHFPQLKLSPAAQPGRSLPELLPLHSICALTPAGEDKTAELELLPPNLAIQVLLSHTAGTRMFSAEMLGSHLSFCSQAARQIPVYRLPYPHREDVLPVIRELLENLC